MIQFRFIDSINQIDDKQWDALWQTDYPFVQHRFLKALEDSGCTIADTGWQPFHLLMEDDSQLIGILPLFQKTHSYGEYVFDWGWADAWHRHGLDYYPKLLNAIPFTPATGPRVAIADGVDQELCVEQLTSFLADYCQQQGISGWHSLFLKEDKAQRLAYMGHMTRIGCQFHWQNRNYNAFDDFLAEFNSRKRKNLRKEREQVYKAGVTLQRLTGVDITPTHWDRFYRFYHYTYLKRSGGSGYLNREFFHQLADAMADQLLMVTAELNGRFIAAALCFFDSDQLYGRYWGCEEEIPGLHFEACYYQGIEFAIEQGLKRFDPGAQGEHKIQRGFEPTLTYSSHHISDPRFAVAIADFLDQETEGITAYAEECSGYLPFRKADA